jgi:hypothetical protein
LSKFAIELRKQLKDRQRQWDSGVYPHSESVFKTSMESDSNLLATVLRGNNETVAPVQHVDTSQDQCIIDSVVEKTARKKRVRS